MRGKKKTNSSSAPSGTCLLFNVGMVAKSSRCLSVMHNLEGMRPSGLRVVAIAMTHPSDSCCKHAIEEGIEVFDDWQDLLTVENLDMILEFTGDDEILSEIIKRKHPSVGVLDHRASVLLFDMAQLYSQVDRRESEAAVETPLASTLLGASPDAVLVIDRKYGIINCNNSPLIPGSEDKNNLLGKYCYEVMEHSMGPCLGLTTNCPTHEILKTGKLASTVFEIPNPDGTNQLRQVTAYPIFNRFGEIPQFVLVIRDMTKDLGDKIEERTQALKNDLARMVQEDRLSSIGRLVASVCHEINNPITSIVTFTKLIRSMIRKGYLTSEEITSVDQYLDLSFREGMRCGDIVKNLLAFSRPKGVEARKIKISEVTNTILLLTSHQLELANVKWVANLPPEPFTAWADFAQIQQVMLNLVFNAIDAMPHGGALTITGGVDEGTDRVWVSVSDTGSGIEPEDLKRIFEPFYSTKTDGKGVGLGLSMVYGIICEHKGVIDVDSQPGKGTTFTIRLPRGPESGLKREDIPNDVVPA